MADLFRDRSCMHWWLPNNERYPLIMRSIREFVEERSAPVKYVLEEDLRDMKAIFASLRLDDGKSTYSRASRSIGKTIVPARDRTDPDDIQRPSGCRM